MTAGAVAAATKRINITIAALVGGLHHPIRLAEDLAVLDHLSDGRLMVVLGIGYRTIEFEVFGAARARRGPLLEELVAVLRQAWTGEPFDFRGTTVVVRPKPLPLDELGFGDMGRVNAHAYDSISGA